MLLWNLRLCPIWNREEPRVAFAAIPTIQNNRKTAIEGYWMKSLKNDSGIFSNFWKGINPAINNPTNTIIQCRLPLLRRECQNMSEYFRWARGALKLIEGFGSI